jgi:hyperosmotically inducible protein
MTMTFRVIAVSVSTLWGVALAPARAADRTPTDKERAQSIEVQLRNDPQLVDDTIKVAVSGKQVRLTGTVDGEDEKAHAADVVQRIDPTATVDNRLSPAGDGKTAQQEQQEQQEIDKTDAKEIKEAGKEVAHKAGKAASEVGDMANDAWITSKIKTRLIGTDGVHASGIDVDTADGVVTLRGNVRSDAERDKALSIARESRGVVKVVDALTVVPR